MKQLHFRVLRDLICKVKQREYAIKVAHFNLLFLDVQVWKLPNQCYVKYFVNIIFCTKKDKANIVSLVSFEILKNFNCLL